MPKITKIVNGEYIGGDKYKITDAGGGKSKVEFSPDNIIKAGTPVGAEILNEVQNNIIYEVLGTRVIEGQEEIYNCTLTGLDAFDFTNIKILMKVDSDNTKDSFLRIGDIKYKIKNKGNNLIAKDLNFNEFVFISLDRSGGLANIINNAYSGVDSNSNVRTASSQAVKKAYDKALTLENSKLDKGGYTKTAKDLDDAIKINSTDISTLKTGKADKSYVDQTFTGKGNYPRTSKNIIEEVMGGEYGDTLNNTDTKTVGKIYYDTATKRNFLCKTQNNLNYANLDYYDDITNKELNSKLQNLNTVVEIIPSFVKTDFCGVRMFLSRENLVLITGYINENKSSTGSEVLFKLPNNMITLTENRIPTSANIQQGGPLSIWNDKGITFQNASLTTATTTTRGYFHIITPVKIL